MIIIEEYKQKFIKAMDDDLNTADALGEVFQMVRDINKLVAENSGKETLEACLKAFNELCDVLGLLYIQKDDSLDAEIEELIAERTAAKKAKDFQKADAIRQKLNDMGIILEDTREGTKWSRK